MLVRGIDDPPDRWDVIGIIGLYEPARGHQGRRNNLTAGNHHHARPAFRARLKVTDLAIRSDTQRSEAHTSELQSLMRISSAVFCLNKKTEQTNRHAIYASATHDDVNTTDLPCARNKPQH